MNLLYDFSLSLGDWTLDDALAWEWSATGGRTNDGCARIKAAGGSQVGSLAKSIYVDQAGGSIRFDYKAGPGFVAGNSTLQLLVNGVAQGLPVPLTTWQEWTLQIPTNQTSGGNFAQGSVSQSEVPIKFVFTDAGGTAGQVAVILDNILLTGVVILDQTESHLEREGPTVVPLVGGEISVTLHKENPETP